MAVLTDPQRVEAWREYMAELSSERNSTNSLTKADIRAAVNALDDYFNANAAAMNTAIPLPARTSLTTAQKARLGMFVIRKRYLSGV